MNPATDTQIRLICFDLGRVIVRICDGWQHACARAGVETGFGEIDAPRRQRLRELVFACETGQISNEEFCRRAGDLFEVPAAHVSAMSDVFLLDLYPGAGELIDEIHTRGYTTACLSNTNENHWRQMSDPSLPCCVPLERFTHRFASHLVGHRKPDDAIYAHVERAVGCDAERIVFFDDLPENVDAARRRGWRAHQILPEPDPVTQMRAHLAALGVLG